VPRKPSNARDLLNFGFRKPVWIKRERGSIHPRLVP
jgi:hypothetical protein